MCLLHNESYYSQDRLVFDGNMILFPLLMTCLQGTLLGRFLFSGLSGSALAAEVSRVHALLTVGFA